MRSGIPLNCRASMAVLFLMPVIAAAADLKRASTAATSNSVDSPSIGYVVRPEVPELRAMLGVPGAARFSDPIPLPDGTVTAEVAPGHSWVLVIRSNEAAAYLPATQSIRTLPGGAPRAWAFSPSGSRAALFYPDRSEVALVSGLPAAAKIESTLQIAQMDSFAIGDNGGFIYAAGNQVLNSGGGLLYESPGALGPIAFEAGRDNIVLFDGSSSSLVEIAVSSGSSRIIARVDGPIDQIFAGSDRIYVGDSVAGTVSLVEYADGSVVTQNVGVSRIAPSAIAGTMLVSFDSDGPAWLVSAQGVSFVPAIVKQGVQ